MSLLSDILAKVNQLPSRDEDVSVNWAGASTEEAVATVEQTLGIRIQGTFREFTLATGGGGLDKFYISTIPADDPLSGGCYQDTLRYREDWCPVKLPPHLLVVERRPGDNEPFCLDTSREIGGENPVVLFHYGSTGHAEDVADSFVEFYQEYLEPWFEDAGL